MYNSTSISKPDPNGIFRISCSYRCSHSFSDVSQGRCAPSNKVVGLYETTTSSMLFISHDHAPPSVDGRAVSIIPIIIHRYSTQIVGVLAAPNSPSDGYFFQCFCSPAYMHSRDQLKQPMFLSRKANNYLTLFCYPFLFLPYSLSLSHSLCDIPDQWD